MLSLLFASTLVWLPPSPLDDSEPVEAVSVEGSWTMTTQLGDREIEALMTLAWGDNGSLHGEWKSQGHTAALSDLKLDQAVLTFQRATGAGGAVLTFEGTVTGDSISGKYTGPFGDLICKGTRAKSGEDPAPPGSPGSEDRKTVDYTAGGRPIVVQDGRTLLWAGDAGQGGEPDYFDVTGAAIDPKSFNHGIGRDRISSIDDPVFLPAGDARLRDAGIDNDTQVIGVEVEGVAKAYPLFVMSSHEIVNDEFAGEPFAVLW